MESTMSKKLVIVGGGFGGLAAARAMRRSPYQIQLIDRRNFHLFQPLLYQVATGVLSPANIASPLRGILSKNYNCQVLMGEVVGFDVEHRKVKLADGELDYDALIVATGAQHSYFGNSHWEHFAPGLKTLEDATEIRRRILSAFEQAERELDPGKRQALLTFVIVGAGPTGVELAGALSDIANNTLRNDFRAIDPRSAKIILVEGADRPLSVYPPELTDRALRDLTRLHVTVRLRSQVVDVREDGVMIACDGQQEFVPCKTKIWAAGVAASALGKKLSEATGCSVDRAGRVVVEPDLSIPKYPEIFVIGDLANYGHGVDRPLPGMAPVAMQQGKYLKQRIADLFAGRSTKKHFRYHDKGSMAVIGRYAAVAVIGKLKLSGFIAWMGWLFIHVMLITQFRNRLLVLMQWGWTFFTLDRSARLITNVEGDESDGKHSV
jgi:NADH:ubiquinone reductase (H+-translocating)